MAKNFVWEPNNKGMRELMQSDLIGDMMYGIAQQGMSHAQSISPYSNSPSKAGHYRDSFSVHRTEVEVLNKQGASMRAGAVIVNEAPHVYIVEHNDRVLRRTVNYIENGGA
jgi:hypothetical protein